MVLFKPPIRKMTLSCLIQRSWAYIDFMCMCHLSQKE